MTLLIKCPTCKKEIPWNSESIHRPFCSKRCQLIDLGQWADESNRIPGDPQDDPSMPQPVPFETEKN